MGLLKHVTLYMRLECLRICMSLREKCYVLWTSSLKAGSVLQINLNIWTHLLLHLFVPSMSGCAGTAYATIHVAATPIPHFYVRSQLFWQWFRGVLAVRPELDSYLQSLLTGKHNSFSNHS